MRLHGRAILGSLDDVRDLRQFGLGKALLVHDETVGTDRQRPGKRHVGDRLEIVMRPERRMGSNRQPRKALAAEGTGESLGDDMLAKRLGTGDGGDGTVTCRQKAEA